MSGPIAVDDRTEWLEADGQGGFASGTTLGVRTRRYHALLLAATTPPTGRMVLVNGLDAWVEPGQPADPTKDTEDDQPTEESLHYGFAGACGGPQTLPARARSRFAGRAG